MIIYVFLYQHIIQWRNYEFFYPDGFERNFRKLYELKCIK